MFECMSNILNAQTKSYNKNKKNYFLAKIESELPLNPQ